jgi:hypothetical protein
MLTVDNYAVFNRPEMRTVQLKKKAGFDTECIFDLPYMTSTGLDGPAKSKHVAAT